MPQNHRKQNVRTFVTIVTNLLYLWAEVTHIICAQIRYFRLHLYTELYQMMCSHIDVICTQIRQQSHVRILAPFVICKSMTCGARRIRTLFERAPTSLSVLRVRGGLGGWVDRAAATGRCVISGVWVGGSNGLNRRYFCATNKTQ